MSRKDFYVWVEKRKRKNKSDKFYIRIEDASGNRTTHHRVYDDETDAHDEAKRIEENMKEEIRRKNESQMETMLNDEIIEKIKLWEKKEGNLIMIFHEVQDHFGYVPRKAAFEISEMLDVKLARIYEVLTFYHYFKLEPPGKYIISVCMGTACYLKGAPAIVDSIKNILNVEEGCATKDGLFQLELVRCIGCCGVAPAISINGEVYSNVNEKEIPDIINKYLKQEKSKSKV